MQGRAYIKLSSFDKAKDQLLFAAKSDDKSIADASDWNLLLIAINSKDEVEVERLVSKITSTPDHTYAQEVKQLKEKLNSIWRKVTF